MMKSQHLPSSADKEFWLDADVNKVDTEKLKDSISTCQHRVKIDYKNREIGCVICGIGKKFLVHEVEEREDGIYYKDKRLDSYLK